MFNGQLELTLESGNRCVSSLRRQRRLTRAQWWFERMRQVVALAVDRQLPAPRPEQMVFAGTHRQPLGAEGKRGQAERS